MNSLLARTTAMSALVFGTLLGASASAQVTKKDLSIGGPYYQKIVQMKDVVADVLPPPAYIIETYLTVLQIVDALDSSTADGTFDAAEKAAITKFVDYGRLLKDGSPGVFPGYYERIAVWQTDLGTATAEDAALKQAMVVDSVGPATTFFNLLDSDFYGLALAGNVTGAKALARGALKTAYLAHRTAIDTVVSLSRGVNARIEREVAGSAGDAALIGGPLYNKVIQMKDLVADVLPPPAYIIESYLSVLELIDLAESKADAATIAKAIEYGRQLARGDSSKGELSGYAERQAFWTVDLSTATPAESTIKDLMINASAKPALAFYEIRDGAFTPRILSGDLAGAKAVARTQLLPKYAEHRAAVDALVSAANARYAAIDAEVRALLPSAR